MRTLRDALLGAILLSSLPASAHAADVRAGDEVQITGSFEEMVFAAGDEVTISATATDDVVAAGDEVTLQNATVPHAFLAGGDLSVVTSTVSDLFAAGGEIDVISGQVTDDVVAAGGRILLGHDARVDGDVVIAGGQLRVEAPVGGDLRAAGGQIYLGGVINGDVNLEGRSITIGPDTHILGSLTHRGRNVDISPQARVDGQTTALQPHPEPDWRPLRTFANWVSYSIMFGMFLMAIVIAWLFPRLMNDTAEILRERPLSMAGLGVGIAILAPVVLVFLALTFVGLPLSFAGFAALALLWPFAIVGAVYAAGMLARTRARADAPSPTTGGRILWAGLAMIAFVLIGLIPVVGFFVWLAAYLLGLGAVVMQAGRALSAPQAA